MKRLLILFIVGLLAGCGASTPSTPDTPVDTGPVYPQLEGTWSDSDGLVEACGRLLERKMTADFRAQVNEKFAGSFAYRTTTGEMETTTFSGQVTESGRLTGQVSADTSVMDAEMQVSRGLIYGTLTSAAYFDCPDGSISQMRFTVSLERE